MPKNKGKGGKNRRRGKNENEAEKRELVFKEDGQEYAQVTKMLGNGRLEATCFDGKNISFFRKHILFCSAERIVRLLEDTCLRLYGIQQIYKHSQDSGCMSIDEYTKQILQSVMCYDFSQGQRFSFLFFRKTSWSCTSLHLLTSFNDLFACE